MNITSQYLENDKFAASEFVECIILTKFFDQFGEYARITFNQTPIASTIISHF